MKRLKRAHEHLQAIGFSPIEATAYTFLLHESPATAYRIAQGLGKSTANIYKAVESLIARGAVMVDDTSSRMCRAVPVEDLVRGMASEFSRHCDAAARALADVPRATNDDRVYQMSTVDQVFNRCRGMLDRATQLVALDIFPQAVGVIRESIDAAVARRVRVALLVYEPVAIPGAQVILSHRAEEVRRRWPGAWVNVVADSAECVLAFMDADLTGIRHAAWTSSAFLAHLYDSGLFGEMSNSLLRSALEQGDTNEEIQAKVRLLDDYLNLESSGYSRLISG